MNSGQLKLWIGVLAVLSLIAGALIGIFVDRSLRPVDGPRPSFRDRVVSELDLTAHQRNEFDKILTDLRETIRGLKESYSKETAPLLDEYKRQLNSARSEADGRILELLDEQQRQLYDQQR